MITIIFLNFQTFSKFVVVTLKSQKGLLPPKDADRNANSEDPYQTADQKDHFDLSLQCLLKLICLKTRDHCHTNLICHILFFICRQGQTYY